MQEYTLGTTEFYHNRNTESIVYQGPDAKVLGERIERMFGVRCTVIYPSFEKEVPFLEVSASDSMVRYIKEHALEICEDVHHSTPESLGCYETYKVTCDCGYTFTFQKIPVPTRRNENAGVHAGNHRVLQQPEH